MKFKIFSISLLALFIFSGCIPNNIDQEKTSKHMIDTYSFDETIIVIANELTNNLIAKTQDTGDIALTSFVQLSNLNKTSIFGRLLTESLFHELNNKNIHLLDFRAKQAVSINTNGEFYLSRNIKALNRTINSRYILVGTYSKTMDKNIIINARILNIFTGRIISTSSVMLHQYDCRLFEDCRKVNTPTKLTYSK